MSAFQRGRIPVLFSLHLETYFGNERYISACTYVYIFTYTPTRILHVRYVHKMYLCVLAGKVITFGKGVGGASEEGRVNETCGRYHLV